MQGAKPVSYKMSTDLHKYIYPITNTCLMLMQNTGSFSIRLQFFFIFYPSIYDIFNM